MSKKKYTVGQKYRTNPLSFEKTDIVVCVETEKEVKEYPNIHSPWAYLKKIVGAKAWWYKNSPDEIHRV